MSKKWAILIVMLIGVLAICVGCSHEHEHTFSDTWSKSETYHWHECTECHEMIDRNGHDFSDEWKSDAENHWHECSVCGARDYNEERFEKFKELKDKEEDDLTSEEKSLIEEFKVLEHEFSDEWKSDAENHWHECSVCGAKKVQKHSIDNDTNKCTDCEYEHKKHVLKECEEKEATCQSEGNIHYLLCKVCNRCFEYFANYENYDEQGVDINQKEIEKSDTVIKKTFHKLEREASTSATDKDHGEKEHYKCTTTGCGKMFSDRNGENEITKDDIIIHNLNKHDAKLATETEHGNVEYYECTITGCGKLFLDPNGDNPTTKDDITVHNLKKHDETPATETEHGKKEHYQCTCTSCKKLFLDSNGKNQITEANIIIHELIKHDAKPATEKEHGNVEYYECVFVSKDSNGHEQHCGKLFLDPDGSDPTNINNVTLHYLNDEYKLSDTAHRYTCHIDIFVDYEVEYDIAKDEIGEKMYEDSMPVYKKDDDGKKIYVYKYKNIKEEIKKDNSGNPILKKDNSGNPIYDENGNPKYEMVPVYKKDKNGNKIPLYRECGELVREDHKLSEFIEVLPSCDKKGVKKLTCDTCGYSKTEYLDITGHSFNEEGICIECEKDTSVFAGFWESSNVTLEITKGAKNTINVKITALKGSISGNIIKEFQKDNDDKKEFYELNAVFSWTQENKAFEYLSDIIESVGLQCAIKMCLGNRIDFSIIKLQDDVLSSKEEIELNKVEFLGSYPQTMVKDKEEIQKLSELAGTLPNASDNSEWKDYGYYSNGKKTNYMWYKDISYNGEKYRGVYFTEFRPSSTSVSGNEFNSYQDDNGYAINTLYWFKFEPIKWKVLESEDGATFLMASVILDAQEYDVDRNSENIDGKYLYSNNYKESHIRNWLNNEFFTAAFDEESKERILVTEVDNDISSTGYEKNKYICENTFDRVFLLSRNEIMNVQCGFVSNDDADPMRMMKISDYARCQGAFVSLGTNKSGRWWLRSPSANIDNYACQIGPDGSAFGSSYVNRPCYGVVPAIRVAY